MDSSVSSIVDIIQMRSWKHALFTTYTLSLSYFESEILPLLLRSGCSDIWLIADAEGYRSSLLERRSMRIGHEYHLVPAALPNGVFHAKSIYLSSDQDDLLLIGSGNITFAGHGRNLEVFEALTPETHGTAFGDFADYLEAMRARDDIKFARTEWIDDFSARALVASDKSKGPVQLLHSLDDPIVSQIPIALTDYGTCSSVSIVSPYHDPDGLAVELLSNELGKVPIAIAVTSKDTSPFPFSKATSLPFPVTPVRVVSKDKRFVHAKLYEFSCSDGTVILSGSINATRKALTTTENVELGTLRKLDSEKSLLSWETIKAPVFEAQSRMPSGLKESEIVYAGFDRNESTLLTGQLISLKPVKGFWRGLMIQADGDATPFEVEVDERGRFSKKDNTFEPFSQMPALQILLSQGDREARGWVHNEMFLAMPGRRRLTAGSLSRIMRREESDDDIDALLDYLSINAENHIRLYDLPVRKIDEGVGPSTETTVITVNLEDLAPIEEIGGSGTPTGRNGQDQIDAFDQAMQRLRKVFLGHGRSKTIGASNFGESVVTGEDAVNNGSTNKKQKRSSRKCALAEFESHIDKLINEAMDKPSSIRALLVLKLEVGMWMRIYRLSDLNDAYEFLYTWFYQACRSAISEPDKVSSLEQHIITNAAILFALGAKSDRDVIAENLHDCLEHFYNGDADKEHLLNTLIANSDFGFGPLLIGETANSELLSNSITEILSHPTIRQQLLRALTLAEAGHLIPREWKIFRSTPGTALLKAFQSPNWRRRIRAVKNKSPSCAFDYFSFSIDITAKYQRYRIGHCIHCKRFTLDVSP